MAYKVKKDDTLGAIASRYGTTVAKLKALNKIKNVNQIRIGQSIQLPSELSKNSPNYTGKKERNPWKGTDLSKLQKKSSAKKSSTAKKPYEDKIMSVAKKSSAKKPYEDKIMRVAKKSSATRGSTKGGGGMDIGKTKKVKKSISTGNPGVGNEVKSRKGSTKGSGGMDIGKINTGNPGIGNEVKAKKKPTKSYAMSDSQRKNQLSSVKKPIKKKSRSNISNSSSYDATFTKKGLEKRGLKTKGRMSDKNYKTAVSKEAKTLSIGGKVSKYYSSGGTVFTGR